MKKKARDIEQLDADYSLMIYNLKHRVQVEYNYKGYFSGHRILGDQEALCLIQLIKQLKQEHPNLLGFVYGIA
jgi:hypothetical protein